MDRLDAMSAFVAIAEHRGFAPAARRLKLSPSVVTRLMAALEDRLGARLLQRTTRSVTLTDAGSRYLARARRILADVAEAEGAVRAERTVPAGHLVLSAPNVFGRLHVAPVVCVLLNKYPAVTGELILSDRMANLVDEGIDVAVRIGVLEDASYVVKKVGSTRRVLVASPKYLSRKKQTPQGPADLAKHELILFSALTPTADWRFVRHGEEARVSFSPRYTTNSADAAIGHAERHGGLTMVLAYQVKEKVAAGKLKIVMPEFEPPPLPIQIVYPTTRLLSAKVRAFVDLIATTCDWSFEDI